MEKMPNLNDVFLSIMASFIGFGLVIGIAQAAFDFGGGRSLLLSSPVFAQALDSAGNTDANAGVRSCPEDKELVQDPKLAPGIGHCVKREKLLASTTPRFNASTTINKKLLDPECMITAVAARDGTILAALNSYNLAVISALNTRTDSLKSAWQIVNRAERKTAIKNSWLIFRNSAKKAAKTLNDAKRSSWQKFNTDRKACGTYGTNDDLTFRGVDAML